MPESAQLSTHTITLQQLLGLGSMVHVSGCLLQQKVDHVITVTLCQ